jgi:hypothetical protein
MPVKKRQSGKEANAKLVAIMKEWQKVEERSINSVRDLNKKVKNPLIKQVLRIIQNDSAMHKNVQQFIVDSLEKKALSLTPEDVAAVWDGIKEHIKMERATIRLGMQARDASRDFIHKYFVNYLLTDERKHDELLDTLESVKSKMYPYA